MNPWVTHVFVECIVYLINCLVVVLWCISRGSVELMQIDKRTKIIHVESSELQENGIGDGMETRRFFVPLRPAPSRPAPPRLPLSLGCLTPPARSHIYIIHLHNTLWCPASSYPLSSAPSNPITVNPQYTTTTNNTRHFLDITENVKLQSKLNGALWKICVTRC